MPLLVTGGSPTLNGDGSCTIDETGADRVQCPDAQFVLDETQGWFAALIKPAWASGGTLPNANPWVWGWADAVFNNRIVTYFAGPNDVRMDRGDASATFQCSGSGTAWAALDPVLLVGTWLVNQVRMSVQNGTFSTASGTLLPVLAATSFDIGARLGGALEIDSAMYWFAVGRGTLTQTDVGTLNALGTTDINWGTLPPQAKMTMRWTCDDFTYETWGGEPYVPPDPISVSHHFGPF